MFSKILSLILILANIVLISLIYVKSNEGVLRLNRSLVHINDVQRTIEKNFDRALYTMEDRFQVNDLVTLFKQTITISDTPMPFAKMISRTCPKIHTELRSSSPLACIVYINLRKNTDRRERMDQMLTSLFPDVPVLRMEGIVDVYKGLGILKSHIRALEIANMFDGPVLILEDDFFFTKSGEETSEIITRFFNEFPLYDVFILSPYVFNWRKASDNFMQIFKATTASGYIVNKHYLPVIIEFFHHSLDMMKNRDFMNEDCNDQTWCSLQFKDHWYAYKYMLGNQYAGPTTQGDYADNRFETSEDLRTALVNGTMWPILLH